ncbi:ABC transporter permease [Paenibacillus sp. GSMTC-2017]|uniref:ABC transporter permease n=1 Tax=Paenibacillus sp. GSMTC-2017 TaxID=2794350 RepID=UPI0018D6534D|nr:ABC transporter permease [Paenibacillus sp. GSMTC-2017]MBH5320076.1 ABC transporter permease [Paenibacillus sp. GSMTC-2017]
MLVFELYMKRILKRKLTFVLLILLPILFTYSVVAQYEQATKVTLTVYAEDAELGAFVTGMLEKQGVTIKQAEKADDAIGHNTNLGIVLNETVNGVYANPDDLSIAMYEKGKSFTSSSLEVKLNSVFSVLKTIAKNAPDEGAFLDGIKKAAESEPPIQVQSSILGNPNAVILTSTFNMIVFIIMFLTMTNTMLFLGDKVHTTTQRILLASFSKLSYFMQTAAVFAVIGVTQFLFMIALMSGVFQIDLGLNIGELLLLVLAYGVLNVVAAGIGLLLVSRTTRLSTGRLLITVVCLPLSMLGGTLWPSSIMPEGMQKIASILPTNWITELNDAMFSGFTDNVAVVAMNITSLFLLAAVLFLILMRVRTENI